MPVDHYENFPVASVVLPARLHRPVTLIYRFAREADDFADEGDAPAAERLRQLGTFTAALNALEAGQKPVIPWFQDLGEVIRAHHLPYQPFHDLLSAFAQDVTRTRYASFDEVLDYCRRSADPVGRLLIALYEADTPTNRRESDAICTALQLINFLQDVRIDYAKGRVYLALDELQAAGLTVDDIASARNDAAWSRFMAAQCARAKTMLLSGAALGRTLPGRIGYELRLIIAGGARIVDKIDAVRGDVFRRRPVLKWYDWPLIALAALNSK